jgi:DNA-binding transcriptional ArsR family regulator
MVEPLTKSAPSILKPLPNCPDVILRHMLNQSIDLDRLFHALADPTRRAMVERLSRGPAPVSELARPLPMSLPAAMQHLGVLEAAGLVRSEKVGRVRTCAIEPQALSQVEQWINARRNEWERRLDRLGDYLKTLENEGDGNGSSD